MNNRHNYSKEGYLEEYFHLFHLKDTAGQERDFHFHEFDKIVILISGNVDYCVEGATYHMQPWDVILVRHHMIHKAIIDRTVPYERIIIYLDSSYNRAFNPDGKLMECFACAERRQYCLLRPDEREIEILKDALIRLEESINDTDFGSEILKETMLSQLMIYLNRSMLRDNQMSKNTPEYSEKIAPALSYINENISRPISIDELADMCYLSRYHFMRIFKAQTGNTVHNYIVQKRLNLAARLIREGQQVSAAAAECGFSDYSAFHRAFTKTFGVSPGKIKNSDEY